MAHNQGHTQVALPPPLTEQSFPELLSLLTAQVLPTLQQRWFTVWHPPALIHKDPRATGPRGLIAMEPFNPVAIRIRKPAFSSHPNRASAQSYCSPFADRSIQTRSVTAGKGSSETETATKEGLDYPSFILRKGKRLASQNLQKCQSNLLKLKRIFSLR